MAVSETVKKRILWADDEIDLLKPHVLYLEGKGFAVTPVASGEDALHAVRGLRSAIHGFATLEVAEGFGLPLDCDESFRRLLGMLISGFQRTNVIGNLI